MLPTEAFAEVVAFLRLFDLSDLAVSNALCSTLAVKASTSIRWEEFPGLNFRITNEQIAVIRRSVSQNMSYGKLLTFEDETATAEFIAAAFPNCIFDNVEILRSTSKPIIDAIGRIADSVIVNGTLCPYISMSPGETLEVIRKFRKVKAFRLIKPYNEANEIANIYRGSDIQEL
ncbi:hypothetical protein AAVH_26458 [Aphelenchoides avenae]|nr:hypothetical protein AAVH_26458 [Aphelenchus avenae]